MSVKPAIAFILALVLGYSIGLETGDSEAYITGLALLLGFCLLLFKAAGMIAFRLWKLPKPPLSVDAKRLARFLVVGSISWSVGWWQVHPSKVRFQFTKGTGASGTWRSVQFQHWEVDRWLDGPSVSAWPMFVRFPDVNGDGCADIQVAGHGKVTFVYLPQNDGQRYWHLVEQQGAYEVSYGPDGIVSP